MGRLEQFAQQTFADETEQITGAGAGWEDHARIDACADLATLERWHDQAITARSAAAALR